MNLHEELRNKRGQTIFNLTQAAFSSSNRIYSDNDFIKTNKISDKSKLKIAYIMNHVRVCGGAKIILEHTNQLTQSGHEVYIVCRDPKPNWIDVKANYIQAEQQMGLIHCVPEVDIIICTVIDQLPECYLLGKAPVVLFEQGDIYIYEFENVPKVKKDFYKKIWNIPVQIFGVSNILLNTLYKNFGRKGILLHNALNKEVFYPRRKLDTTTNNLRILFVGQEENAFKGVSIIREALQNVKNAGYRFEEVWVTQTPPKSKFTGTLLVNPSQQQLGEAYRKCDIFISGSYYESFPLPPLEAMACGCAVVSTDNEGIMEYAVDNVNSLIGKVGNSASLAECLIELIENSNKRSKLVENGYFTAGKFEWNNIMSEWEEYLKGIIHNSKNEMNLTILTSLHIQLIPNDLDHNEVNKFKNETLLKMEEDWCLFLVEGESIEQEDINLIRKIISRVNIFNFLVPVTYEHDVPGHPITRNEMRLVRKNNLLQEESSIVIPVLIKNGSKLYFSPRWLNDIRSNYWNGNYNAIIDLIKDRFVTFTKNEQLIASKWIALALLEQERFLDALSVLLSAIEQDPTYSDIFYLCARIYLNQGKITDAKKMLQLCNFIGTSLYIGESFANMEEMSSAYLAEL